MKHDLPCNGRAAALRGVGGVGAAIGAAVGAARWLAVAVLTAGLGATGLSSGAWAQGTPADAMQRIGRVATPAEVQAWDTDVRADFKGLPAGAGSVARGQAVWEEKCAGCHGIFGESNDVFTPLVGGTTRADIATGRVRNLATGQHPHRSTLMKLSRLSTLWDYIYRAMPWTAPKSLSVDEVYATVAYLLHLGDIVPADFSLSERNIADVQQRLPNRHGKALHAPLWDTRGTGDVRNPLCMKNCPVEATPAARLPDEARNTHGNIAEQVRPFGAPRGTDTSLPPRDVKAASAPR